MTALQKDFSHREGAKDAKIFKNKVQDFKSFSKRFAFPSCIINFLRVFAVKGLFFSVNSRIHTDFLNKSVKIRDIVPEG